MKRKSVPVILSVVLGACACVLFAALLVGGGYAFLMRSDSQPTQQSSATNVPNASSATVANVTPTRAAVPTVEPNSNPPSTLPDPAATNSGQALENVARITYAALAAKQDLKPYINGVMTAFGVPPLGEGDVTMAGTRLKQGLPLMFLPQVADMADAFNDGGFVSLDSFIAAANNRGAKQQGTNNPLTRTYLTLKFAAYAGKALYGPKQTLPAFVLALGKERAKRFPPQKTDPLWGDGLLDPLQLTLLLYSVSYADAGPLPTAVPMASVPQGLGLVHRYMSGSIVNGPIQAFLLASFAGEEPIRAFIVDQIRGQVEGEVQDAIGMPLDRYEAAQVSVCASLLLYGHKLTVTTTPKLIYHKDGTKPWSTRVDVALTFQDDYHNNYLPIDRWMLENLGNCTLPHQGAVEGSRPLEWSVSDGLISHGTFNVAPPQTDDNGKAAGNWQTVPETTPESQRVFANQRDAVGAVIVRAGSLVPGWSGLERVVGALRDTGNTGDSPLTVIYYKGGYKATEITDINGNGGPASGVICDLGRPFTILVNIYPYHFTPSNPEAGSVTVEPVDLGGTIASYTPGPYTVKGVGTDTVTISVTRGVVCYSAIGGDTACGPLNAADFHLVPLDTNECSKP